MARRGARRVRLAGRGRPSGSGSRLARRPRCERAPAAGWCRPTASSATVASTRPLQSSRSCCCRTTRRTAERIAARRRQRCQATERADGSLVLNMIAQAVRLLSFSHDGGDTWSPPTQGMPGIQTAIAGLDDRGARGRSSSRHRSATADRAAAARLRRRRRLSASTHSSWQGLLGLAALPPEGVGDTWSTPTAGCRRGRRRWRLRRGGRAHRLSLRGESTARGRGTTR